MRKEAGTVEQTMMKALGSVPGSGRCSSGSAPPSRMWGSTRGASSLSTGRSENNYNGVNCGIMDQFAVAMGKKDCAIFLDTSDLSFEYAPVKLENARIVIASSNKKRGLGDSKYNERRSECETALAELQTVSNIQSLGELTVEAFEQIKSEIKDPVRVKRARHAVAENQRTMGVSVIHIFLAREPEIFMTYRLCL